MGVQRTTDHLLIREWAERREAVPTSGPAFDFPVYNEVDPLSWDRWFAEFEGLDLEFVYRDDPGNFYELRPRSHG
ncbi:hypothetical protein Lesp02_68650 [Lentzea sp. NBRC 105346]|nr:hypothetical protein Lesp02_68650 [Lentzea sp. NBRC 105346]